MHTQREKGTATSPEFKKMRIDNSNPGAAALGQTAPTTETQAASSTKKGSGAASSSSSADGLQLSKFAGSLSQIMESDSANRSQRVAQLAAAVQSGTYKVDPQAVSRALVDHAISAGQNAQ
jgi:flagellar biosynthesis anti-sigma factor FlgM